MSRYFWTQCRRHMRNARSSCFSCLALPRDLHTGLVQCTEASDEADTPQPSSEATASAVRSLSKRMATPHCFGGHFKIFKWCPSSKHRLQGVHHVAGLWVSCALKTWFVGSRNSAAQNALNGLLKLLVVATGLGIPPGQNRAIRQDSSKGTVVAGKLLQIA